jgi:hypothetical protein
MYKPKIPILVYFGRTWFEKFGIFLGHFVFYYHFGICYGYFGIFVAMLVYYFSFWFVVPRKIWQPWLEGPLKY